MAVDKQSYDAVAVVGIFIGLFEGFLQIPVPCGGNCGRLKNRVEKYFTPYRWRPPSSSYLQ